MARIRTIKPEFWTDERVMECSPLARLLFIGSWNFADDYGNIDRASLQLKARVLPADNVDPETLVKELTTRGLFVEYSANGKKYLHIKGFSNHQRIDKKSKSRIPRYEDSLKPPVVLASDDAGEGKGREGKGKEGNINRPPQYSGLFETWWSMYPKKTKKTIAYKSWEAISPIPDKELLDKMLGTLGWQIRSEGWTRDGGNYIPMPSTYLNQRQWEDEPVRTTKASPYGANNPCEGVR